MATRVRDVIIVHVISGDTQTDAETAKDQLATFFARGQLVKIASLYRQRFMNVRTYRLHLGTLVP